MRGRRYLPVESSAVLIRARELKLGSRVVEMIP
jgi:hypothetical protein